MKKAIIEISVDGFNNIFNIAGETVIELGDR